MKNKAIKLFLIFSTGLFLIIPYAAQATISTASSLTGSDLIHEINTELSANNQKISDLSYNVKTYGAAGNGTTDDTAAIQAAINAAVAAGGGRVFFPPGTYAISTALKPSSYISLMGVGVASKLKAIGEKPFNMLSSTDKIYHLTIKDIYLDGSNLCTYGLYLWLDHGTIDHLFIYDCVSHGIFLCDSDISTDLGFQNIIKYCEINVKGRGIYVRYPCTDSYFIYNNIGSSQANIYTEGGPFRIFGNHLDGNPEYNYYHAGGNNILFACNICENSLYHSVYITHNSFDISTESISLIGNIIRNGSRKSNQEYDLIHYEGVPASVGNFLTITGNVLGHTTGNQNRYAFYSKYAQNITLNGNLFDEGAFQSTPIGLDIGSNFIQINGNTNNQYTPLHSVTPLINDETSGTAVIPSGSTTISVTHNLGRAPNISGIAIIPTNSLGNASKYYISAVSSTTFTIAVDADPGNATASFAWKAKL